MASDDLRTKLATGLFNIAEGQPASCDHPASVLAEAPHEEECNGSYYSCVRCAFETHLRQADELIEHLKLKKAAE